jgi:hypothetical protein
MSQGKELPIPETNLGKINIYTCNKCFGQIITIDSACGVTPFMLACRATKDCDGDMMSAGYMVDQNLKPTYEWYKQNSIMATRATREHIRKGGLSIKKIKESD